MFSNLKIRGLLVFVCFEMMYSYILILVQSRWLKWVWGEVVSAAPGVLLQLLSFPYKAKGERKWISWLKITQGFSKGKKISASAVEN